MLRADIHTSSAASAFIANGRLAVREMNRMHETLIDAGSASSAVVCDSDGHPRHPFHFRAYPGVERRQPFPEAAATAAIAYGHEFFTGFDLKPRLVDMVSPDQMDEAGLPAFLYMSQCLLETHFFPIGRINILDCLAQEQASQLDRMVLAVHRLSADAKIHDEPMGCVSDEMFNDL